MNSLLQAVLAGDHGVRPILADWYEDAGDAEAAGFWRRSHAGDTGRLDELPRHAARLLPAVRDEWLRVGLSCGPTDRAAVERLLPAVYEAADLAPPRLVVWLSGPYHGAVGAAILSQVGDQVRGQVRDQVWGQVWDQILRAGYGTQDAAWLSFYFALDLLGFGAARRLRPLFDLSRLVGWWWPFAGGCVLTDLPTELVMGGGRLRRIVYADGLRVEGGRERKDDA